MAGLQQAPEQQQQQQPRLHVEGCVELVARAVKVRSPGGSRKATATATTTTIEIEVGVEAQEEAWAASDPAEAPLQEAAPVQKQVAQPRTVNWEIADGRRAHLETEPAKSNLARTNTLQGVAERMLERVTTEAHQLLRLQEEVESATGASALDAVRLWLLERGLERRVRHHLSLVFREMHLLREAHHQFDARAVALDVGSPALRLLHDPSGSSSSRFSGSGAYALPAAGSRPALGARRRGRSSGPSSCSTAAADDDHHRVSEAEEPSALASSGESTWAAAEVAAAMATAARGHAAGGDDNDDDDAACRFSPVQWSRDRFDKVRTKGNSDSSSNSDGLLDSARALHDVNAGSREDATLDKLMQATSSATAVAEAVEEAEACAAMAVFRELQRQFEYLADTLRQHALVADGVLRQAGQWKPSGGGAPGAEGDQGQQQQQQLLHEVALMHCETQRTQVLLLRSERALQRIADSLPPAPTMVRLPPSPPLRRRRLGLDWFSTILKRRFLRRQ
ncbi:uncharacterized protein LOC126234990 [Schistocerca nitens]|uniref:uncharacterized protein LOC126234990 n=1 Tax=Schistocerca nitens TaxID=7011 RepID=UPI002117A99B|nr:uncharacterized protein LOC126234990 [Schistocerca nitens]